MGLTSTMLVGRFQCRRMGNNTLQERMKDNWEQFMGCSPICFFVSRVVSIGVLVSQSYKEGIKPSFQVGFQPLLLKNPNFDMKTERLECVQIWFKCPIVSLIFWYEVFMEIIFIF